VDESVRRAGADPVGGAWSFVQLAHAAPATTAIVTAQDLLGLGGEARMNTPGTTAGNWSWRLQPGQLTRELAHRLRELTQEFGRA
jgi:4-alpha-glucanotransferase